MMRLPKAVGMIVFCVSILTMFPFSGVFCAETFPDRPVTVIVNFGAGGPTDVAIRLMTPGAEKKLGQPIIISNKPGAGGVLGVAELAKAKPDGYTIGASNTGFQITTPMLQKVPYDPHKDFDNICSFAANQFAIYASTKGPYKTLKDVVEAARKNPGMVNYGATSIGVALGMKYLESKENLKMKMVQFQSGPEMAAAVVGGHLDLMISTDLKTALEWLNKGDIKALAVATDPRSPDLPNVPTFRELGYDIDLTMVINLAAPAGVPKDRLKVLTEAFRAGASDPDAMAKMKAMYMWCPFLDGEQTTKLFQQREREWKPFLEALAAQMSAK